MRTRLREALDADLDVAVRAFKGSASDRRLWASIAWRVGVENFHYALADKLKENDVDKAVLRTPAAAHVFPRPEKSQGFLRGLQTKGEIDDDTNVPTQVNPVTTTMGK